MTINYAKPFCSIPTASLLCRACCLLAETIIFFAMKTQNSVSLYCRPEAGGHLGGDGVRITLPTR